MKLLFDTHTFIWWDSDPERLSDWVREACADPGNTLLLSVASVWEMQIKAQLGKLELRQSLAELVTSHRTKNGVEVVPVALGHVLALERLPLHHRDPFDRVLIAQAQIENAVLMTIDSKIRRYDVEVRW